MKFFQIIVHSLLLHKLEWNINVWTGKRSALICLDSRMTDFFLLVSFYSKWIWIHTKLTYFQGIKYMKTQMEVQWVPKNYFKHNTFIHFLRISIRILKWKKCHTKKFLIRERVRHCFIYSNIVILKKKIIFFNNKTLFIIKKNRNSRQS